MTDNHIRHATGGALILLGLLTYGINETAFVTTVSWLLMAAGAYLITQAFFAIVFTVFALSLALYFSGQSTAPTTLVLMLASGITAIYALVSRFATRIRETRSQRWQHRQDPAIKAILFDFDGTLAPNLDLPDMRRRVIELTEAHNVPQSVFADHYIVEIIDVAKAWLVKRGQQTKADDYYRSAHQLIIDIELAEAQNTEPFPDVRDYLATLKSLGIQTGVVTRNCREAVYTVFPDIDHFISVVCARDDVAHFKPDPRHLSDCLARLATDPTSAAMIGDGQMDMQTGKALGMYCVGVTSGSSGAGALREAGADIVVDYCFDYRPA